MPDHPLAFVPDEDVYEDGQRVYAKGRQMPWSEAVRLGLVPVDEPEKPKRGRRMKRPDEDRMHRLAEDRSR